jgi:hypothetical protein
MLRFKVVPSDLEDQLERLKSLGNRLEQSVDSLERLLRDVGNVLLLYQPRGEEEQDDG